MRRSLQTLLAIVSLPFLAGCYTVTQISLPPSHPERQELDLRGVVVNRAGSEEEVLEFQELHEATWTPSALSFVADVSRGGGRMETVTRLVPLTEIQGVIVRQFDAGTTSALIGGAIVGTIAFVAILVTGDANSYLGG